MLALSLCDKYLLVVYNYGRLNLIQMIVILLHAVYMSSLDVTTVRPALVTTYIYSETTSIQRPLDHVPLGHVPMVAFTMHFNLY